MKLGIGSLHARLGLLLLLMLAVLWASLWLGSYSQADRAAGQDIDARLRRTAITVAALGQQWRQAPSRVALNTRDSDGAMPTAERAPRFEVRTVDGRVIAESPGFPQDLQGPAAGFASRRLDSQHWRVLTYPVASAGLIVRVALNTRVTAARAHALGARFAGPLLWLLPALLAVAAITLWQGLRPLRRLTRRLADIDPAAPQGLDMDSHRVPDELATMVAVLDGLLYRMGRILSRQRLFAAAVGHELRTPLAGCRSQIDVARRATDLDMRDSALARIDERIGYMSRLATQLHILARASSNADDNGVQTVTLAPLVREVLAERSPQATAVGVALDASALCEQAIIAGVPELARSLIDNLVRNAIEASPSGGRVKSDLVTRSDCVQLTVSDQGPGLDEPTGERVFEPFVRGHSKAGGSGLGLAIVDAVAETQQARVIFDQRGDGDHEVIVSWPRVSAAD